MDGTFEEETAGPVEVVQVPADDAGGAGGADGVGGGAEGVEKVPGTEAGEALEPVKPQTPPVMLSGAPPRVLTVLVMDHGISVGVMGQCSVADLRGAAKALMMGAQQAEAQEAARLKRAADAKMALGPGRVPNRRTV